MADLEAGEHKHHWDQPNHNSKQLKKVDEYKGLTMIFGYNLSVCVYTQGGVISCADSALGQKFVKSNNLKRIVHYDKMKRILTDKDFKLSFAPVTCLDTDT